MQYVLRDHDGMTFNSKMLAGTIAGNMRCQGVRYCQFETYDGAMRFCNNNDACIGILQQLVTVEKGCPGDLGCFYTANGQLHFDQDWKQSGGKTYERQFLSYNKFQDGRKLSLAFTPNTRQCPGVTYCEFQLLSAALAFCDLDSECLGVMKVPSTAQGDGCHDGQGCYIPARGEIQHDPLWFLHNGETFLKQQEVAYLARDSDGYVYNGRFPAGTAGCPGTHNCQFQTLAAAEAYCNANPTCKGVLEHTDRKYCAAGDGCFEPCRGKLEYKPLFLVTEGKLYERHLVR
jgi:hypothetical protein